MTPYFFTFSILALLSFSEYIKGFYRYRYIIFLFTVFYLILFAGLRKLDIGADDIVYYYTFLEKIPDLYTWIFGNYTYEITDTYMEPGYVIVNSFIKLFTEEYTYLFLIIAFISISLASYNYYRYSKYIFLTLLLFYVHTYLYRDMTQIRSAIAAAFGLFLVAQLHYKQHFNVILTLVVSSLFHMASLSLIVAYMASFIKLTRTKIVIAYLISLIFALLGLSSILLEIIPGGSFIALKLSQYIANERYLNAITMFDITNIKNSFLLFMVVYFWNQLKEKVIYFETIALFITLATVIRIGLYDLGVIAARISTFFGIVEVILIPYFILLFKQKKFITLLIILYGFVTLYLNIVQKEVLHPYQLAIF